MKTLKKKIISLVLTLVFLMSVFTPLTVCAEDVIIDTLCIDFTTENAHPAAAAYELRKELKTLEGENISNGTEDVGYCMNVYLFSYTEPNMGGTRNQIESEDTDFLDPNLYYYVNFEISANNGFDFKHDGTSFDTTSLTTVVNGHEMIGIADDSYNEYWKVIDLFIPVEIDTTSKVYSVEITNSDVNVEKGDTIQFQSKTVSYGDGYDAVIWSLEGAQKAGTTISSSGLLTVAADETADSITVKVCSEKDAEKYDTVTLNVLEKLAIDSVEVDPQSTTLFVGDSEVFTATVTGTDTHEVEWQLTGNSSANTTITPNEQTCTLAVGEDETAGVLTIEVTSVKDPTKSATASITVKQITIIDRLLINYTTEKAMTDVPANELRKELKTLEGENISNGTEDVGYCMNVYLFSYTEPNMGGTRNQIGSGDTDFLDPDLYYYVEFEISANDGFDFKHDGTSFDTTSLTTVVNGHEMTGIADDSYNEYWKVIDLFIPIEINTVEYTVSFDSNGGSAVTAQSIEAGQKVTKPADPTKANYAFAGWYSDSGLTQAFDFNTPISTDITLYAKWNEIINSVTATVTAPVGGEHPSFTVTVPDGAHYTAVVDTWYDLDNNGAHLTNSDTFVTGNEYQVRIHFTANTGYEIANGASYTINGTPNYATFDTAKQRGMNFVAVAPAVTTYTVTYDANGGSGTMVGDTVEENGKFTLENCTYIAPEGYKFKAWAIGSVNGEQKQPGEQITITGETYIYAIWEAIEHNVPVASWKQDATGWWYDFGDGTYAIGWEQIDGTWYYFDSSGFMQTGWQFIGGTWYYFASSGAMQTGWQLIGGTWYYFASSGAMQTGWLNDGGTWYYFHSNGAMATGWVAVGGTWYYFAPSGAMQTGWLNDGGTWYYFHGSGAMATGWVAVGGTWYYFASSGAMQTGWLNDGGSWYYLAPSGAMQTGWVYDGGAWYFMNSSGVWVQ